MQIGSRQICTKIMIFFRLRHKLKITILMDSNESVISNFSVPSYTVLILEQKKLFQVWRKTVCLMRTLQGGKDG